MSNFEFLPSRNAFTPTVVNTMVCALSDAWQTLNTRGARLEAAAEIVVRETLAKGVIASAELGERDPYRLCDAALAYYARHNPLSDVDDRERVSI